MKPSEYLKDHWWSGARAEWVAGQECIATVVTSPKADTGIAYDVWGIALRKVLGRESIFDWNDSPERTLEEVLEVARKAEDLVLERKGEL